MSTPLYLLYKMSDEKLLKKVRVANIGFGLSTGFLLLLLYFFPVSLSAQVNEITAASTVVANASKITDINILILTVASMSLGFAIYLVKQLMQMQRRATDVHVQSLEVIHNLTKQLENRPCWLPKNDR